MALLDLPPDDPDLAAHRARVRAALAELQAWRRRVLWPLYGAALATGAALLVALPLLGAPFHWAALSALALQVGALALSSVRTTRALRVEAPFEVEHALTKALGAFREREGRALLTLRAWGQLLAMLQSLGILAALLFSLRGAPLLAATAYFAAALGYAGALAVEDRRAALEVALVREGLAALDEEGARALSAPRRAMTAGLAVSCILLGAASLAAPLLR